MYLICILCFLCALVLVGVWFSKRVSNSKSFLSATEGLPWYVNTGTLTASYLGSGSLIGSAALAFNVGISAVWLDVGGILGLIVLALMAKRIRRFQGGTTPEILGLRYSDATRVVASAIIILAETAICGYQIKAGAYVLNVCTGIDTNIGLIITAVFIIGYTVTAGLLSVAYTDMIQGIIIIASMFIGLPILLHDAGGVTNFVNSIESYKLDVFSMPLSQVMENLVPTFALFIVSQPMWQRVMAGRNPRESKLAVLVATPLIFVVVIALAFFAVIGSFVLPSVNPDIVILSIAKDALPVVIGCLMLCAGVAIIVSTGDTMLLSSSSCVINDYYLKYINPNASDKQSLFVSRAVVIALGVIALIQVKFFPSVLSMVYYAYTMEGGLAPALVAAFFWKRATKQGAFVSVVSAGLITILWEVLGHPFGIATIFPTLIVSTVAMIVVSLLTPAPKAEILSKFFDDVDAEAK